MLRPNRDKIDPKYLLHQWLSPLIYEDHIMSRMIGSVSPPLNIGAAKAFEIHLPPLSCQRQIVAYLEGLREKAEELARTQAATSEELQAMVPAILYWAFRGELLTWQPAAVYGIIGEGPNQPPTILARHRG